MFYNKEKYSDLFIEFINIIRSEKIYVLPSVFGKNDNDVVEILLSEKKTVIIESKYAPIRHGNRCGSRIHLGSTNGIIDYNPKLIWNGTEWLLQTFGTIIFAEMEINPDNNKNENN